MKKKSYLFVVVLLTLSMILAACSSESNPASTSKNSKDAEKVVLGSIMSTSGASNGMGLEALKGIEYAVQEINEAGGFEVNGKTYQFDLKQIDDESNPQAGVSAAERLISENKAKYIFLSPASSSSLAEAQITEKNKVIGLVSVAAAPGLTEGTKYIFRNTPTAKEAEAAKVKFSIDELKAKKFAILARNDDWGKSGALEFKKYVEKLGGEIVAEEYFKPGTTDFYSILTEINKKNPDVLDVMAVQNDGVPIVKQSKELGLEAKIFGAVVWNSPSFIEAANSNGVYAYSDASTSVNDKIKKHVEDFEKAMGEKSQTYDKSTYDLLHALVEAMKKAGTVDDTDKVRDAMLQIEYNGVNGALAFQENGQGKIQVNVTQIVDGKPTPVKELSGAEIEEITK
jgi:branched-chain amino acid transport system substrate-binding protein